MTWLDFILKLVETLTAIAWPAVVWLIWCAHKDQVRDFLTRVIKLGPSGMEAVPPQQTAPSLEAADTASAGVAIGRTSSKQQTDIVLNEFEQNIRENLKQTGQDNLPQDKQKSYLLQNMRNFKETFFFTLFHIIYSEHKSRH